MTIHLLALLIGLVAGLRTMAAPAMVCWAVTYRLRNLRRGWLVFLGNVWVRWILTLFALVELVIDQLPTRPSGTVPVAFGARMVTGALSGAAVGARNKALVGGAVAGVAGAVLGTLGG